MPALRPCATPPPRAAVFKPLRSRSPVSRPLSAGLEPTPCPPRVERAARPRRLPPNSRSGLNPRNSRSSPAVESRASSRRKPSSPERALQALAAAPSDDRPKLRSRPCTPPQTPVSSRLLYRSIRPSLDPVQGQSFELPPAASSSSSCPGARVY
ncbi:hypothetical protein B0H15DRAFT_850037 [Mycena belliarum]|uniref:Uncharacterized protein n=1 Tax=Mycena belliarum TaxID=1033014 RepID=A0AAD6XNI8_9AGAR|nr:hypothetical protein B0H15DRAFT_850037 [Mycena belliae]